MMGMLSSIVIAKLSLCSCMKLTKATTSSSSGCKRLFNKNTEFLLLLITYIIIRFPEFATTSLKFVGLIAQCLHCNL